MFKPVHMYYCNNMQIYEWPCGCKVCNMQILYIYIYDIIYIGILVCVLYAYI